MSENSEHEELTYIISHDLQEPIRMVNSYVKLLERKYKNVLDEEAIEYIKFAVDGAGRLKSMLDDLLSYSRLRKENVKKSLFNISEVIDSVLKHLEKKHGSGIFEIICDKNTLPEIFADKKQLSLMFLNLFENSIKFNDDTNKRIFVTYDKNENNNIIEFCISDNGIGIDKQYHDRIFKIFQKLHNQTEYSGSGIGLAMCKKIVENHDGQIWIESEPEKGSKFYFSFPIVT